MKKLLLIILFFSTVLLAQNNSIVDQSSSKLSVQGFGGLGIQTAPEGFSDYSRVGLIGGVAITLSVSETLSLRARGDYTSHMLNTDKFEDDLKGELIKNGFTIDELSVEGGTIQYYNFDLDLIYHLMPNFYLVGGIGAAFIGNESITVKINRIGVDATEKVTEFGRNITFGAGYKFPINKTSYFFLEAKFNRQFFDDLENVSTFPIIVGYATEL